MNGKENNIGQTVYEQLQEILNKCIEKGWSYRFITKRDEYNDRRCITLYVSNGEMYEDHSYVSYHDLFSKDSGLMEFVEWNSIGNQAVDYHDDIDYSENEYAHIRYDRYYDCDPLYHYAKISNMTAEHKVYYFVKNAIIPTK